MRLALPMLALLALAASPRGGCGDGGAPYVACEGKACGAPCTACPPGASDCVETAVVKACDPLGRCVPDTGDLCGGAVAPCEGKACGDPCTIEPACRASVPPCMVPSVSGHCDGAGACVAVDPAPPGLCIPSAPPE